MEAARRQLLDLVVGGWRSRILVAGVELGVFEVVGEYPKHAVEIADQLDVDADRGYRLLRALGSLGLLAESRDRRFSATSAGELLREGHPGSLRGIVRAEASPTRAARWSRLPDIVREGEQADCAREGEQDGVARENGRSGDDHRGAGGASRERSREGATGYENLSTAWARELLAEQELPGDSHVCAVGGDSGQLLRSVLEGTPGLEGTVLERHDAAEETDRWWTAETGAAARCSAVTGDPLEAVPAADVYLLTHALHDRSDDECGRLLATVREAAPGDARLFVVEHVVPGPDDSPLAALLDVRAMVRGRGRERTSAAYAALLADAGWEYVGTRYPEHELVGAVEAVPA